MFKPVRKVRNDDSDEVVEHADFVVFRSVG